MQQIVQLVDEDGSEMIEFDEFLSIIKPQTTKGNKGGANAEGAQGTSAIFNFFKKLTTGRLQTTPEEQDLPF